MKPFFQVKTSEEIYKIIQTLPRLPKENVHLTDGLNRVLGNDIFSPEDLPHFPRATMDGFAVRARDTFGASEAVPALLTLSGEISMGQEAKTPIEPGHCFRIATGGMVPPGADSVVMIEHSQQLDSQHYRDIQTRFSFGSCYSSGRRHKKNPACFNGRE